jgi:hypothetical protein
MTLQRLPAFAAMGWIVVLLIACLMMLLVLQPGLPVGGNTAERMRYISEHALGWQLGWYSWMLSAIGLLMFALLLRPYLRPGGLVTTGVVLIGIGVLPDLTAESIFQGLLVDLSQHITPSNVTDFEQFDMLATALTGIFANGAYNIGGLCLNVTMFASPRIPRWLAWSGLPAWILGLGLSLAVANQWLQAAYWFTATAMPLSILWCTAVTLTLFMQPARYRFHARMTSGHAA